MDFLFQIVSDVAVIRCLAIQGARGVTDSVIETVQKSRGGSSKPSIQFFSGNGIHHQRLRGKIVTHIHAFIDINNAKFRRH